MTNQTPNLPDPNRPDADAVDPLRGTPIGTGSTPYGGEAASTTRGAYGQPDPGPRYPQDPQARAEAQQPDAYGRPGGYVLDGQQQSAHTAPAGAPQHAPYGQQNAYGQQPGCDAGPYAAAPGPRYGTQAYGMDGQYGVVEEPKGFRTLLMLTLASAAVWLLSSLLGLFGGQLSEEALREQAESAGASGANLDQVMSWAGPVAVVSTVVTLLIGLGLYALVYFGLRSVNNWARILGIVFAILSLVFTLPAALLSLFAGDILDAVVSLAFVGVNAAWLVHAFSPQVAAYLRQGRRVGA